MSGVPDQNIHPVATGLAAKTVEKHQGQQPLVFYAGWFCPFVQRTWITLEEKGIPYQYVEVNPYKKEKHFLEINPKGLVPAIEYKGKALYESLVLSELLEEEFPNHTPNVLPKDPVERAYARIWIDYVAKSILPWNMRLIQAQEADKQKDALDELNKALRTFAEKIKGPYFLGEQFSLVDIAIVPWVVRDYIITENRGFSREGVSPKWKQYADLVEKRDSVLNTQSDKEYYAEIYGRYLRDEAQSELAKAIRAGKPIP
ncbi:glutathione-S-transferase [Irpex rosettiformis]|uniref:Glutathione-S-transferase n=1 Tax=Irpex rosettiformis TaxID=378272 RepID=A0ACB8U8S8_9APHY|nr:glutathione-S-transferase [Irpex rosettiformis]